MPAEFFPKIKQDFSTYEKFRKRKKPAKGHTLAIDPEKPRNGKKTASRCVGELQIEASLPSGDCKIHARVSIADNKNYTARIFADYFGEAPCLRFCSTGRPHINRERGKGLPDRVVPTPHFHKVDKRGIMEAYQKDTLLKNVKQIEDVASGINLFCQESNVVSPDDASVVVKLNTGELGLSIDDPFQNVRFLP
jgi:hypothetical protein